MASSYIPYLPPTFTPEMEIIYQDGEESDFLYDNCKKNPGHTNFIPLSDFKMEQLPPQWQSREIMDLILIQAALTVKISSCYISENRPSTYPGLTRPYPYHNLKGFSFKMRCGTGLINYSDPLDPIEGEPCPCHICKDSDTPKNKYACFYVHTATHVIYDTAEAAQARFEVFYDSPNCEGVEILYGVKVTRPNNETTRAFTDMSEVMCVTHNMNLADRLTDLWQRKRQMRSHCRIEKPKHNIAVMVSHPHGTSKKITVGRLLCYTFPTAPKLQTDVPYTIDSEMICRLPLFPWSNSGQGQGENNSSHAISEMKPGSTFPLPSGMTFTIPTNSTYGYQFHISDDGEQWMTFAPETTLTFPSTSPFNGKPIHFPPETEFLLTDKIALEKNFTLRKYKSLRYNLDSCPGCSGAGVTTIKRDFFVDFLYHTGAVDNCVKLSGLTIYIPIPDA